MPTASSASQHSIRSFVLCLVSAAALLSTGFSQAQGVPHLSVNPSAYHTLIAPGTTITSVMCQPADSYCLAHDVGQSLVNGNEIYASDRNGNVYVATASSLIYKLSAQGQPTIIAGQFGQLLPGDSPLTSPRFSVIGGFSSMAVDDSGNLYIGRYVYGGKGGEVVKIDTLGVAHRITAVGAEATTVPVEDALASTQAVDPQYLATDAAGNLYIDDVTTSTIRKLSASTGRLDTAVGCLTPGCNLSGTPTTGDLASKYNLSGGVAVDNGGTLYLASSSIYAVTPDGILHVLANVSAHAGVGNYPFSGPVATTGNIGYVSGPLTADAAGDLYFAAEGADFTSVEGNYILDLVELTRGTPSSPAQVMVLANGPDGSPPYLAFPVINPEGMPSNLTLGLPSSVALDAQGRLLMSSAATPYQVQQYYAEAQFAPPGAITYVGPFASGIVYFDRNGADVFNNNVGTLQASPQIITLTNSGTAPLVTVNIAGTGYPYYVLPTAAELAAEGTPGPVPFTLDQKVGTCLAKYAPTRTLTLEPGESCTLAFDYTPNPSRTQAGSFILYTNDPRGPLTVNLTATGISGGEETSGYIDETSYGIYYTVALSATVLKPSSLTSSTGEFTIPASVASDQTPGYFSGGYGTPDVGYSLFAIADLPFIPTGRIYAAASNNATGAITYSSTNTLDADGKTTFTFTNLAPATYSVEAVYLGDGINAPSYSTVQTLTVLPKQ